MFARQRSNDQALAFCMWDGFRIQSQVERKELYSSICRDLEGRQSWDQRQSDLYRARYRGLRRTNKPWPNASDINWPLVDAMVDKLKPYYFQQLYATELIATFQPTTDDDGQSAQMATSAAQWFDYHLKQESDFEEEVLYAIDYLLMLGRPSIKVAWDVDRRRLNFTAIEPAKLIVANSCRRLWEADRIVHVLSFTPDSYRQQPAYRQGEEFIKRITGRGQQTNLHGEDAMRMDKYKREGITDGIADEIIVWEVWERDEQCKWSVESFAPVAPEETVKARTKNPFDHGYPPFADIAYELTQPNWYAPRGVAEVILPFQAELTKLWNEKNDAMTLANRPLFTTERDVPNTGNLRWKPGQILPFGVKPTGFPPPPIDIYQAITMTREIAETLVQTPDYGLSRGMDMKKARTATEMEQLAAVNQQSSDLRMRTFRMGLGRLFQLAWLTLRQYRSDKLAIWINETLVNIPKEAIAKNYKVRPSGSADGVTRQTLWRRAVGRLQMFAADPFIDQGELRKSVLESDDAGLVKRLFRDPMTKQATQAEDQVVELGVMRLGFPAIVTAADEHGLHIQTVLQYLIQQKQAGVAPAPGEMEGIQAHLMDHIAQLMKMDARAARAAMQAVQEVLGALVAGEQKAAGARNGNAIPQAISQGMAPGRPAPVVATPTAGLGGGGRAGPAGVYEE